MKEKSELDVVIEILTQWVTAVKLRNSINDTAINRISENLVVRLLNVAYGYELKNLNWEESNYPAVDLGDRERGIAFQVTATDTSDKIRETLKKFYAHDGPHKQFPEGLYFFFLKEKPPVLKTETKKNLQKFSPCFDPAQQMWGMKTLLVRMEELYSNDRELFDKIKEILEEEFGYGQEKISRRKMMKELYRGSKRYLASLRGGGGRFRFLNISDTLLTPTRKNKQKEWLDTPVKIDEKMDEYQGEDKISTNVLVAIPRLWQKRCMHALLKGDGGMGKTVSIIRLWEQYTANDVYNPLLPVPVFIPLNEYNETDESERKGFIQRMIRRFYLEEKARELDLLDVFKEPPKEGKKNVPSVLIMLDGLNEVSVERTMILVELREIIEHWQGVQLLVSSRPDMRDTMNWMDFHLLELVGLGKKQIDKYLSEWNLSPLPMANGEEENRLRELLHNPMMLTIYASTSEVVKEYGASSFFDFKLKVETPGELLWNFLETQVVKHNKYSGKEEGQTYFYKFLLKILLPAIGYEMEKVGRFQFTGNELDSIVECYLKRFCQEDFLRTFREYKEHTKLWSINGQYIDKALEKVGSALKILSVEMSMLVKEEQLYRFLHQDFRDFFAGVHILNEAQMGISRGEVADVLTEGMISYFPQRYMGEVEGEHYRKPYLQEGEGWQIKSNESTVLAQVLEKCRRKYSPPYAYAVANILNIWKLVRGEWSGLDLKQLNLSNVLINRTVCSRLYGKSYLAACFDGSIIPFRSLIPHGHENSVYSAVYSPDGKKILSASGDGTIREWDVTSGMCLRDYWNGSSVNSAVYSADGKKILSASYDGTIKEWDVSKKKCLKTYLGHKSTVNNAVYSPDGKKILSTSYDGTIKEWDVSSKECLRTYLGCKKSSNSAIYSPDGKKILSTYNDRTIREWDVASGTCLETYQRQWDYGKSLAYSDNGQKILYTSDYGTISEWDVSSKKCLQTYQKHIDYITSAAYSNEGKRILSASGDKIIKEWDVVSGACLQTYQGHTDWVNRAVYSPDGQKILSASNDKTIKEWDVASGACLRTYLGKDIEYSRDIYSADGKKNFSTSENRTIKEWDVSTGICIRVYLGHESWVNSVSHSPDGLKILSTSNDKTIKEWDVTSGACLRTYHGHHEEVTNAIYTSDGKKIFSISWDSTIKEWDTSTGRCLRTLERKELVLHKDYPGLMEKIKVNDQPFSDHYPGLFIQGCSFKNIHCERHLSHHVMDILKEYGAINMTKPLGTIRFFIKTFLKWVRTFLTKVFKQKQE